jgi:hypothetical protein
MRGERYALRAGEYLVGRASRRLPAGVREQRRQEWLAELPVILHDRDAGPAPRRVVRMLSFAADTLRGTTVGAAAYRYQGTHRGHVETIGRGVFNYLLLLGAVLALLGMALGVLAYQGWIVYQLIFAPDLWSGAGFVGLGLILFAVRRIRRSHRADDSWGYAWMCGQGAALMITGLASQCGWGHPLLFSMIGCTVDAFSVVCLIVTVRLSFAAESNRSPSPHE